MKNVLKKNFKTYIAPFLVVLLFVVSMGFYHSASSSALQNVSGFAWGADDNQGLGWISFNDISDPSNIPGITYGVNIDASGNIEGYAWTPNYGWLRFGGLSGFPTGGGTTPANAKLTGNTVTGWARFCAGTPNQAVCDGATIPNTSNGGWDGWVSLNGSGSPCFIQNGGSCNYGVTLDINTGQMSGYAWGGNDGGSNVVGWIDFSDVEYELITDPTVSLSVDDTSIEPGDSVDLSWSGLNLVSSPTGCTASDGWSGTKASPSGGPVSSGSLDETTTFTITCTGLSGGTATDSVTVTVDEDCPSGNCGPGTSALSFYPESYVAYPPSYTTTLYWSSNQNLNNCVADSMGFVNEWDGSVTSPNDSTESLVVSVPNNPTTYKLTCDGSNGTLPTQTINVSRGELPLCENPNATNQGDPLPCEFPTCDPADVTTYNPLAPNCFCNVNPTDLQCENYCAENPTECRKQPIYIED